MRDFICIDVGGTFIKYGVINETGNIIVKSKVDTDAKLIGGLGILNKIKTIIKEYIRSYEIFGICISTAGVVDTKSGEIIFALEELIPNYTGLNIKKEIENEFNINCEVENDVNCVGLSEIWLGQAKGVSSAVCIALGTGIGGCIIIDKKVFSGFSKSAGEVGYMNINGDIFQDIASTNSLVKKICKIKNVEDGVIDGKQIFEMAKNGDTDCINEINNLVKYLCIGISNICYVINPEVIVLGGGIMAQENYLRPLIEKELKNILIESVYNNTLLKFATNQNDSGMIGALYNFLQKEKAL